MDAKFVTVRPVPPAEAGAVLSRRSIVVGNLLTMSILAVFWASVAGVAWGAYQVGTGRHPAVEVGVAAASLVLLMASAYVGLKTPGVPGNLYLRHRARRQVAGRRAGRVVDPDRPGPVPVHFVQVVPRQNWGRLMLETATDTGFLQVDPARREVRFEGDVERFVIPADAILSCDVESYAASAGNSRIVYSVCVLRGRTAAGPWEAPISLRGTRWFDPPDHRRRTADALAAEIAALRPAGVTADPDEWAEPDDAAAAAAASVRPRPAMPKRAAGVVGWVFVIALGIGMALLRERHRPPPPQTAGEAGTADVTVHVGGSGADEPALPLTIHNVRRNRAISNVAPFDRPGGDWTVFDCVTAATPPGRLTVAVRSARPTTGPFPIAFTVVQLLPGDRADGGRLVASLADALHRTPPRPTTAPAPLVPVEVHAAQLGTDLGSPEQGLPANGGHWVATKWFLVDHTGDTDAEVFFDYDLSSGRARFSEKDVDYDDDVLAALAVALRDGGPPPTAPSPPATQP